MKILPFVSGYRAEEWRLLRGRKAFAATAGNGAQGAVAIADVSGQIELWARPLIYCSESLVGPLAVIDEGVTGNTNAWNTDVVATDIVSGRWAFTDSGIVVGTGPLDNISLLGVSANILLTVKTADISDGQLDFFIWWRPLSSNGNLVLATGMTAI